MNHNKHTAANEQGLIENNGVTYTVQEIEDWHRAEGYVRRGSAARSWLFRLRLKLRTCSCLYPWTPPCEFCKVRHGR